MRSAEPMYHSARPPLANSEDPGVLEELADDRADADVVGHARAAPGAADAPRTMRSISHAGLGRFVQRLDRPGSTSELTLKMIRAGLARPRRGRLALDQLQEARAERDRRHEEAPELALAREAGQDVEQVGDVRAELRAAGEQPEVHVQAGRPRVVVAGADVDVAPEAAAFAPHDERDLRVGLEADEPVDDVRARLLELAGPDDVRLLVEARLDLDQDHDLLAAFGGADEVAHDRRVAAVRYRVS